jgi:hypothetical protein
MADVRGRAKLGALSSSREAVLKQMPFLEDTWVEFYEVLDC